MKDQPLTVKIVDGELRISIGVSQLKFACEHCPDASVGLTEYDEDSDCYLSYEVTDEMAFADDVNRALQEEDEDGTTMVHQLLDKAMVKAIEDGAMGIGDNMKPREW